MLLIGKGYAFEELTTLIVFSQAFIGMLIFGIIFAGLGISTNKGNFSNDEIVERILHPRECIIRGIIAYLVSYIVIDAVCLSFVQITEKVILFWTYFNGAIMAILLYRLLYKNKMAHYIIGALFIELLMECYIKIYDNIMTTNKMAESEAMAETILILSTGIWGIYTMCWIIKKYFTYEENSIMDIFFEKLEILNLLRLKNILNEEEYELQKIRLIKQL